jgi:hypothetical protein
LKKYQKVRGLLTKRESELVQSGSVANVKFHSPTKLKSFIKLARKYRDKYRDLSQRQIVKIKHSSEIVEPNESSLRTIEKAKIFNKILNRYETRYENSLED